ncbi:unnamed protein product, partial [marine sediment metagenome]
FLDPEGFVCLRASGKSAAGVGVPKTTMNKDNSTF